MTEAPPAPEALPFKPKKSVALSGTPAGNTALCSVGRSGNDLHYRGYDILDLATATEFEEVAHLLVHGTLPNVAELTAYKARLKSLRGLPAAVKAALECLPAASHPMDVMRTGVSVLGCVLPEKEDHNVSGARDIADQLLASLGSMLLYWYHFATHGRHIDVETDDDSIAAHFLHLLHGTQPSEQWVRAMQSSLNLYAEHEFNASTFAGRVIAGTGSDIYSCIAGAIGALRGPKHGGANEVALDIQKRYDTPDAAEEDILRRVAAKEVIIGFGHPVYTISDPRNKVIKEVARELSEQAASMKMFAIAERLETVNPKAPAVVQHRGVMVGNAPRTRIQIEILVEFTGLRRTAEFGIGIAAANAPIAASRAIVVFQYLNLVAGVAQFECGRHAGEPRAQNQHGSALGVTLKLNGAGILGFGSKSHAGHGVVHDRGTGGGADHGKEGATIDRTLVVASHPYAPSALARSALRVPRAARRGQCGIARSARRFGLQFNQSMSRQCAIATILRITAPMSNARAIHHSKGNASGESG